MLTYYVQRVPILNRGLVLAYHAFREPRLASPTATAQQRVDKTNDLLCFGKALTTRYSRTS